MEFAGFKKNDYAKYEGYDSNNGRKHISGIVGTAHISALFYME